MKTYLWRSLLVISLGLAGAYLGLWSGATYFVPKSSGLAGGAMVLGYAVSGFVGFAVVAAFLAFRLQGAVLRKTSLIIGWPVLFFYLILAVLALSRAAAEREPDSAFAAAGKFTVTLERVDTSDPYLFVKMEVDSRDRTWQQTGPAPENKVCSATINAKNLIGIRKALDALLTLSPEKRANCNPADQPIVKRLHWTLMDGNLPAGNPDSDNSGFIEVTEMCLQRDSEVTRTFLLVEKISLQRGGKVRCD